MIRKLLLLLVVTTYLQNTTYSQGAEIYGNAFWQSANNRVVIRLALRNPTGSSTGQMKFVGMRFGFQYNAAQVTYAGYTSYMSGLNASDYIDFIGPDTAPNAEDIDASIGTSRTANISGGGTKTMQQRYIARSTNVCDNALSIPAGTTKSGHAPPRQGRFYRLPSDPPPPLRAAPLNHRPVREKFSAQTPANGRRARACGLYQKSQDRDDSWQFP